MSDGATPVTVVVATRNRREELLGTLERLLALAEAPPVVVVDNASSDGTADAVAARHRDVTVVRAGGNLGGGGRTLGAAVATTPYVAFSDDDSWWEPGALALAAAILGAHPRLGLLAARILVGQDVDPTSEAMAASPLGREPDLPGPSVLGFVACGAVVRRDAFLAVGGFHPRFVVGGEETLLAVDLAAAGWGLAYVDEVVARHQPSVARHHGDRQRREVRNRLLTAALRRPAAQVVAGFAAAASSAVMGDADGRAGFVEAVHGLGWALARRRLLPAPVEAGLRTLTHERARSFQKVSLVSALA